MVLLSFLFILCSCKELVGQNQEEMNNKAIALLGNLYRDVKYLDKEVSYHAVVSSGAATVEVYINGYPIHREPAVVGKSGSKSGSNPINKYILQSGEQHWEVRVYPAISPKTINFEKEISKNARFIVRLEKLRFTDVGVETLADPIVLIETPINYESDNSGNVEEVYKDAGKPMMVYKGTFAAQVPYVLDGWSKSVDLTQENSQTLQKELVEKYKELLKMLDERRTGDFAEKIVKREKEISQALFYTKDLNDDYMETFFEGYDKKDKKMKPLENYKMVFFGKNLIALESNDINYLYKPSLIATYNNDKRRNNYLMFFHRPKPGAPLEIIR